MVSRGCWYVIVTCLDVSDASVPHAKRMQHNFNAQSSGWSHISPHVMVRPARAGRNLADGGACEWKINRMSRRDRAGGGIHDSRDRRRVGGGHWRPGSPGRIGDTISGTHTTRKN